MDLEYYLIDEYPNANLYLNSLNFKSTLLPNLTEIKQNNEKKLLINYLKSTSKKTNYIFYLKNTISINNIHLFMKDFNIRFSDFIKIMTYYDYEYEYCGNIHIFTN